MTSRKTRTFIILIAAILLSSCSTIHHVDEGGIGGSGHAEETSQ